MPHTSTINFISGIYSSDCCGIEQAVTEGHTFPPCTGGKLGCGGDNANWTLVRKTETKETVKSISAVSEQTPANLTH
jgi:hypothetical protein